MGGLSQIINFTPLKQSYKYKETFILNATGGFSGNPVTFSYTSNTLNKNINELISINGTTITAIGIGSVRITASQLGNSTYATADHVTQTIDIIPNPSLNNQTIIFNVPAHIQYIGNTIYLDALADSSLPLIITCSSAIANVIPNTTNVFCNNVGEFNITLSQPGDDSTNPAVSTTFSIKIIPLPSATLPNDSCFPEKTPINCDQGIINIDKINPDIHTINKKSILAITKSIYELKNLVCFEKDSLYKNVPSRRTEMTFCHKIFYNGKMREARELIGLNDKIYIKKNKCKFVYNILMKNYDKMLVNNLIADTLHPESRIAKYYAKNNYKLDKHYEDLMLEMSRELYTILHKKSK